MSEDGADRRAEFEARLDEVRVKGGTAESEQRAMVLGLVVAGLGVLVTLIAFFSSTSQSDTRDVISFGVVLGLVGVAVTIVGSAVYLRYAFGRFLRFWMLRMLYEQRADDTPAP